MTRLKPLSSALKLLLASGAILGLSILSVPAFEQPAQASDAGAGGQQNNQNNQDDGSLTGGN